MRRQEEQAKFKLSTEEREARLRAMEPEAASLAPGFRRLGLRSDVCLSIRALGLGSPTPIQTKAIPAILKGESVLLSAQTGTGKTLAFLLPLVHRLKEEERRYPAAATVPHGTPRALIMVPNRELGQQIYRVAKLISHVARIRVGALIGGKIGKSKKLTFSTPLDILVTTPGRLGNLVQSNDVSLSRVRIVVVDEADTMYHPTNGFGMDMDEVMAPIWGRMRRIETIKAEKAMEQEVLEGTASEEVREKVRDLLEKQKSGSKKPHFLEVNDLWKHRSVQWILASATVDRYSRYNLQQIFPFCREISSNDVHRLVGFEKLSTHYIDVRGGDKMLALLSVMEQSGMDRDLREKQKRAHEELEKKYSEAADYEVCWHYECSSAATNQTSSFFFFCSSVFF